jgi:hypothetical protein
MGQVSKLDHGTIMPVESSNVLSKRSNGIIDAGRPRGNHTLVRLVPV